MKDQGTFVLAGDAGGTKTFLSLYAIGPDGLTAVAAETYASRDAGSLEEIIARMLSAHPVNVAAACFGIAGPVTGGESRPPNLSWAVSEKNLKQRFGWANVRLLNDLSATALAVPLLGAEALAVLNAGEPESNGNIVLIAPGTGLGQALLLPDRGRYLPMASEGGHTDFAPTDDAEIDLWRYLYRRFGHVSLERVLSGPGLVHIYDWLTADLPPAASAPVRNAMRQFGQDGPPDQARIIARLALDHQDDVCRSALLRFCRILGAAAGNLALTGLATGGVFIGGGIPPKILPMLKASDFMSAFTAKGRFSDLMKTMPVRVILNERAALLGAAHHALAIADGEHRDT